MISAAAENSKINRDSWLIFVFGILAFTVGLNPEFIGFQTRFALFAREMLRYGPTFFLTSYQIPYADYPATGIYLIYLFSLPFGKVTVLTAVLPTAITSALILVFIYRIGALQSRTWGILAVMMALFTFEFFQQSQSVALDQYTSLATVCCFYLAYSATVLGREKRLWLIPLFFLIGFGFRGPPGLVLPAAVTSGFFLGEKRYKKCLIFGLSALILFGLCSALLLTAAYHQGGRLLVDKVIQLQAADRLVQNSPNYHYYLIKGFTAYAVSFPLAVIVIAASWKHFFQRENPNFRLLAHLTLWLGIILMGMSVPEAKKTRYLLPLAPALALLSSYMFVQSAPEGFLFKAENIFFKGCRLFPFAACVAALALFIPNPYFVLASILPGLIGCALLIGLSVISLKINRKIREYSQLKLAIITVAALSFIVFNTWIIGPLIYSLERTKPFVEKVERLLQPQTGTIAFYQIGPDAEDIKFVVNMNKPVIPAFVQKDADLLRQPATTFFIAQRDAFESLPPEIAQIMQVHLYGKIGHRDCVLFSRKTDSIKSSMTLRHDEPLTMNQRRYA